MARVWQDLTDPLLLLVFSNLNRSDLYRASKTCKNWYRISQDESLWKRFVVRKIGTGIANKTPKSNNWKSECKRLEHHVPRCLHQTCLGHTDEVYYVCFSPSGKLIGTCGADGYVTIWAYGENTVQLHTRRIVQPPSYANYIEFNTSETLVLVNFIWKEDGSTWAILAALSVTEGLNIVAARHEWFPNFRGTWLDDKTFLNVDVFTYFFSNENVKIIACEIDRDGLSQTEEQTVEYSERDLTEHLQDNNVCVWSLLEFDRESYRPHFVKVIEAEKWNASIQTETSADSHCRIVALYMQSLESDTDHMIAFYKINIQCEEPSTEAPMKIIMVQSACLGVSLSSDQRYLTCNFRRICSSGGENWYDTDVQTMIVNLADVNAKPEIFRGNSAVEQTYTIYYFFPNISEDFVASGSERDMAYLWDRHSEQMIEGLKHHIPVGSVQVGVNAVAFHPLNQEILVSVADDYSLRVWASVSKLKQFKHTER